MTDFFLTRPDLASIARRNPHQSERTASTIVDLLVSERDALITEIIYWRNEATILRDGERHYEHEKVPGTRVCRECSKRWPCPTSKLELA